MVDFERIMKSVTKSGRIFFGSKRAIEAAKSGKAVAFILSSNCPSTISQEIERYAHPVDIPVHTYPGTSADLGMAFRKPFAVAAVTIRSLSDPNILKILRNPKV